jgi:3',5'-cyclic AMP phosphodiesterase CpdA
MNKVKITTETDKKKRLIVISDTHITQHDTAFNSKMFDAGIKKINKIDDATLYLHLGDLTHSGTLLDYEHALREMSKFKPSSEAPIKYVIGNHDSLNVGYLLFEEIIGKRHFEFEDENLFIIGIDSTKPDLASGIIHQNTLSSMENQLKKSDRGDKIKIVCFHHQTIPIPKTGKERSAIDDSGDTLKMLLDTGVDLVINGHRHISNLYNVGSPKKDLFVFNSGTFSCNKTRYRELFTYNIIDIEGNMINFKIFPILESQYKKEIDRKINFYHPREVLPDEKPFCKIIQISNTLLNKNDDGNDRVIDHTIDHLNKIENIDLIVHVGNLTKNGYESEFKLAKKKLNKIKHPYIVVPGHTDSYPPAWDYWKEYIGPLDPSYKNEKIFFQGINSSTKDSTIGYIGRKRLRLLIEKVLRFSREKVCGFACFHSLIPTPLSVWRTELSDSGDVLSQLALSQIDVILNSTPSVPFNLKVENSLISNGGNLRKNRFDEEYIEINIYKDGLIKIYENKLRKKERSLIGSYTVNIFS